MALTHTKRDSKASIKMPQLTNRARIEPSSEHDVTSEQALSKYPEFKVLEVSKILKNTASKYGHLSRHRN